MIIIDGKVKRNLQEQVGYNAEQIEKIFELIDGLNVQDNLVKVTASSGILTPQEMEVVSRDVAFIVYNDKVYIKSETSASEFIFKQVALTASDQGTYNILQSFRIVVTRASGAYAYSSNTVVSFYNKAEMDSTISGLNSAIAGKASLSGADFTGNVTTTGTISQATANYEQTLNLAQTTSEGVVWTNVFNKFEVINGVAYLIANFTIENTNAVSKTIYVLTNREFSLPSDVASKIYDINGDKASDAVGSHANITNFPALVNSTNPYDTSSPTFVNSSFFNGTGANGVGIRIAISSGLSIAANTKIMVTARVALTLI